MNGAELAEGVVLHVEPAASGYGIVEDSSAVVVGPSAVASKIVEHMAKEEKEAEDNDDEELQDFFDSL